jgi:hypothetical protein
LIAGRNEVIQTWQKPVLLWPLIAERCAVVSAWPFGLLA